MPLTRFPRVQLAHSPTPLEAMPRLAGALGGAELWIKRDDCTGLAFGGNKARQLEYYFGEAIDRDADTVIITGAVQSNFVRQAAAAARRLGMEIEIQLENRVPHDGALYNDSGNVLLDRLLGARIHYFPEGEDEVAADANMERIADDIRARGGRPYVIHLGADHPPLGALGYIDAAKEILEQATGLGITIDEVVVATGSAATHSGLLTGLRLHGSEAAVRGICVRRAAAAQKPRVLARALELEAMAGLPKNISETDVWVSDAWFGPGYGQLTPETIEAMELTARHEGILLDPVYTGKAMAGLIGLLRGGDIGADKTTVFVHTGGTPALFAYDEFMGPPSDPN